MRALEPCDEAEICEAVGQACVSQSPLAVVGAGSRSGLGRPVNEESTPMSIRRLDGVVFYEPAELVICARAGTPVRRIKELLSAERQELAFEPMNHGTFYSNADEEGTIGGLTAVGAAGPRRIKVGSARDHLLGFRGVTGRGEAVKSGGRVMKNVTGFDLSKLICGSHGTLAVLTEVTFKVLPKADTETTVSFCASSEDAGLSLLRHATALPLDISGCAVTPDDGGAVVRAHLRFEGTPRSIRARIAALRSAFEGASADMLDEDASRNFWRAVRDADLVRRVDGDIWRISTAPTNAWPLVRDLRQDGVPILARFYDWAGGLVWLTTEPAADAHSEKIRSAVDRCGGHATLVRAKLSVRTSIPVFHPQASALAALTRRIKNSFDPLHILNRGRVQPEF